MFKLWQNWEYKNLTILTASIIIAVVLSKVEIFHSFLLNLGGLGYLGAFIAGIMFVSIFTVSTSAVILLILAERLSPLGIGVVAGLGSVIGDYVIFRFLNGKLIEEIEPIYTSLGGNYVNRTIKAILETKYFNWLIPVIGAIIIASPLPDEIGISLLGFSKMKTSRFLLVSFILNSTGIFLIEIGRASCRERG